jgi:hypothetical protein
MTLSSNHEADSKPCRTGLLACEIVVILLMLWSLTGCATVSAPKKDSLNIYQTPVLRLPAGTKVQTVDGVYTAQEAEVWHSDYRYRELERSILK